MRLQLRLAVLLFTAVFLMACAPPIEPGAGGVNTDDGETANPLANTHWDLIQLGDMPIDPDQGLTLDFEADTAGGYDGCNRFGTRYMVTGNRLHINEGIGGTLMMCVDRDNPNLLEEADLYKNALRTADTFELTDDDRLIVQTDDGELVFVSPTNASLVGPTWQLAGLAKADPNGDGVVMISMGIDQDIQFTIEADTGRVSGHSGCNTFSGPVEFDENGRLDFGMLAVTMMMCEPDVMEREQAMLQTFEAAARYNILRHSLTVYDAEGTQLAEFTAAPAPEEAASVNDQLLDTRWDLAHTVVGGDAFVPAPQAAAVYLTLTQADDGSVRVTGNAGCNTFNGTAVLTDADGVRFEPLAMTRMACDPERNRFEQAFVSLLAEVVRYEIEDDTLHLYDADDLLRAEFRAAELQTFFVGAEQVDCVGVGPQKCLLVKRSPEAEYTFFYDEIAGFEWEAGFEYELVVSVSRDPNPPLDASALRYTLVEVVSRTPVDA